MGFDAVDRMFSKRIKLECVFCQSTDSTVRTRHKWQLGWKDDRAPALCDKCWNAGEATGWAELVEE